MSVTDEHPGTGKTQKKKQIMAADLKSKNNGGDAQSIYSKSEQCF